MQIDFPTRFIPYAIGAGLLAAVSSTSATAQDCPEGSEMVRQETEAGEIRIYCRCLPGRALEGGKCVQTPAAATAATATVAKGTKARVCDEKNGCVEFDGTRPIQAGDEIRTGVGALVNIIFSEGARITVGPHSVFILEEYNKGDERKSISGIIEGKLRGLISCVAQGGLCGRIRIARVASTVAVAVRGTEFVIDAPLNEAATVVVIEGHLELTGANGSAANIGSGEHVVISADGTVEQPAKIDLDALSRWWEKG